MSKLDAPTLDFATQHPEATRELGFRIGRALLPGDVICLQGDLGAGKTTFVQGIAQGWGSIDAVSSPTFILVNVYRQGSQGQLFHMDAYRLDSVPEAEELDLETMLAQGALLIEWPERLGQLVPDERLWITFEHNGPTDRMLRAEAKGARAAALLDALRSNDNGEL